MQFHAFGASRPGVLEFVFDFDLARKNRQLRRRRRFLEVNSIIDGNARLELGHSYESVPDVTTDSFQFRSALAHCASGPCFQAQKNESGKGGDDQDRQREGGGPGEFSPSSVAVWIHDL